LSSIFGGDKHNAIPREAEATFLCPLADEEKMRYALAGMADGFQDEFAAEEPDLAVAVELTEAPSSIFTPDAQTRLIYLLLGLPNGVLSMMRDVPGVVETSNNLAKVRTGTNNVHVLLSARSAVKPAIDGVIAQIEAVSALASAKAEVLGSYPGWKPNMSSELLARSKRLWKETHGAAPEVHVVHAGLECGLLSEKYPEMDMISLGPTIENAHSPKERVSISSVARFYDFAVALVTSLAAD
jgi:dipeptidase D